MESLLAPALVSAPRVVAAASLVLLAGAHSVLGEKEILRPLLAAQWSQPAPRWAHERILRFAWHLSSVAWLALAALALNLPLGASLAGVGLLSAGIIFFSLRGHLAWPLFTAVGVAGLQLQGWLSAPLLSLTVGAAVLALLGASALHLYWVAGGRFGLDAAIPSRDGEPAFQPPAWLTAAVALALLSLAGLLMWVWGGQAPRWASWAVGVAGCVMLLRAIGDGKQVGLSKAEHESLFARWDDRVFTPVVLLLAGGCGAALLA